MKKLTQRLKAVFKEESAQGMAEYVLLIVAVVGLGILFRGKIQEILEEKMGEVGDLIGNFGTGQ